MGLRVLLIDDSEADRLFTRIVLERSGAADSVVAYESAGEALQDLASGSVDADLILLDINMPGMNGFEFLEAYRQLPGACAQSSPQPRPPAVVMLTSSPDPTDRERALQHPCVKGYVTKPIDVASSRGLTHFILGDTA
jgi:CheY-like chemotaxis protein